MVPTATETPTQIPTATPTPEPPNTPQSDRAALAAFYEATNGPNWINNTNWLSDLPIGTWFGVTSDETGRVVELSLVENNLRGEISTEVGQLFSLSVLALWDNQLIGEIPAELGNLANLKSLFLDANDLSGKIPAELGNLNNLTELWLDGNRLTGCLPDGLTDVSYIDLSLNPCPGRNALAALYESTDGANWTNDANWLSDKPLDEWYGVTTNSSGQIIRLDLSNNRLNGKIPVELGNISNLATLFLFGNSLDGEVPVELGNLANLRRLFIGGNLLDGCIPDGLQDVPNNDLTTLRLPFCGLADAGAPVDLVSLAVFSTSPGLMNLTWSSGVKDVTHQEIFRDGESIATPQQGRTWYAESGLDPNTRYEYRVEFQLSDGSTVMSEAVNIATLAQAPLITPMNVTETAITVAIVDTMNPEETTYRVTLSDGEGSVISDWGSSRCRTIENLQTGVGYEFEVVARNLDGFDTVPVNSIYYGGPDKADYWSTQLSTGVEDAWSVARIDHVASLYGLNARARQWMTSDIRFEWKRNEPGYAGYISPDLVGIGSDAVPAGLMHEFMHGYFEHWNGFSEECDVMNLYTFRRDFAQFMLGFREYDQSEEPNPWEDWRPFYNYFVGISRDFTSADGKSVWGFLEESRFNELWHAMYHVAETDVPAITAGKLSLIPPPLRQYFEGFLAESAETKWEDELRWYANLTPTDRYLWDTAYPSVWVLLDSPEVDLTELSFTASIAEPLRQHLRDVDREKLVDFVNILEDLSCTSNCEKLWEADFGFWQYYVAKNLHRSQFYLDELSPNIGIELEKSNLDAIKRALGIVVSDLFCGDAGASQVRTSINAVSDITDLQREALQQMIEVYEHDSYRWDLNCVR